MGLATRATADQGRRAVRRLTLIALLAGCAQTGAPPGGPPDDDPPHLVRIRPDTNARNVRAGAVSMQFDEVISERPQGATGLSGLFLISPSIGEPAPASPAAPIAAPGSTVRAVR